MVPASLKYNWEREVSMWMNPSPSVHIISGMNKCQMLRDKIYSAKKTIAKMEAHYRRDENKLAKKYEALIKLETQYEIELEKPMDVFPKSDIYIINYDLIHNRLSQLQDIDPQAIIMDECHYIKDSKTLRSKAVLKLCKGVKNVIALSGTPLTNRPKELFPTLNIIRPDLFSNYWKYAIRYCEGHKGKWGWDDNGSSNIPELNKILKENIMIRRLKNDVLKELPEKIRTVIPMDIDNMKAYQRAENDLVGWVLDKLESSLSGKSEEEKKIIIDEKITSTLAAEGLVKLSELKQVVAKGKMKGAIEWIQDHIDSNGKLIVFCTHQKPIDDLMKKFSKIAVKIDGSVSIEKRQKAVDEFQTNDKIRLFIGNIKAAGVGITLTAASSVCFLELGWTPGEHDQAEDRAHRIGQMADVNAYYLIGKNTIEEDTMELIDEKRKVLKGVLDGAEVEEKELLKNLWNNILNKN